MIEVASEKDLPGIMDLMREFHTESNLKDYEFCESRILNILQQLLNHSIFISRKDGVIDGFICSEWRQHPLTGIWYTAEALLFISKKARHGIKAARLLKAAIAWNKQMGGEFYLLTFSSGIHREDSERLAIAMGATQFSSQWRFDNV